MDSYELRLLFKIDWDLRENCLLLKQVGICCKKFQRVHSRPFVKSFQFFDSFYYRRNFYIYWPTMLSESTHMNCASSVRVSGSLEKFLYFRPNFYFYWPTLRPESIHMNCATSAKVTKSLETSIFAWNDLLLAAIISKECTLNPFDKFSMFLYILL